MQDRYVRGALAGVIGGVAMDVWSYISAALDFGKIRFVDWSSVMIFGYLPVTKAEEILALVGQVIFSMLLGIVFVFMVPAISSRNLWFKGMSYAFGVWFLILIITLLFNVKHLVPIYFATALSNFIGALIYGLVLASMLMKITPKENYTEK